MHKHLRAVTRVVTLAGALAALPAGTAIAATDESAVTVAGATNTLTAPAFGDFAGVTLDGTRQTQTTSVSDWGVADNRGTGAGWSVTMSASQPQTASAVEMPASATLTLAAPTASASDAQNASGAPAAAGGNLLAGPVNVAVAGTDEGMGAWELAQGASDLSLVLPSETKAGTYTSTITTTLGATL